MPNLLRRGLLAVTAWLLTSTGFALAQPQHGVAMFGEPALPADFTHLPYANPDAPFGGRIVTAQVGTYDSLNPHITRGSVPWQLRALNYESLLGRSWDEPFTLYGLLAESVEIAPDGSWVEFVLRPEARFSDGSPVTVEDVIWSYETLGTEGHGRYRGSWARVESIAAVDANTVRITFNDPDRELAMIMGLRPILKAEQWADQDFTESGMAVIPITTAPYQIAEFEAGRYLTVRRDADYWGRDLPFRRGTNVIDEIRMEFFGDATAMREAFVSGRVTTLTETSAQSWAQNYDFPRVTSGEVVLSEVPHQRPSGMTGLAMNTRRAVFQDWRVRDAMIHAFNAEFINQSVNGGADPRITSYFSNSALGMRDGPADPAVRALLEPFADALLPGALEGYALPVSDGSARNRAGTLRALERLAEAGFTFEDGVMTTPQGAPMEITILTELGSSETNAIITLYAESLQRLGIDVRVERAESLQFREQRDAYDFDMIYYRWGLSLSPGNEQRLYWSCDAAAAERARNMMGACHPAIEAMIDTMLDAPSLEAYQSAVRALDRVLTTQRYVVPFWYSPVSRIAHDANLRYPETVPIYGHWAQWQPDVWWVEPGQ